MTCSGSPACGQQKATCFCGDSPSSVAMEPLLPSCPKDPWQAHSPRLGEARLCVVLETKSDFINQVSCYPELCSGEGRELEGGGGQR